MSRRKDDLFFNCAMTAGFALVILGIWIGRSYMEARAYEHITGKPASTWDAMWIDLGRHAK